MAIIPRLQLLRKYNAYIDDNNTKFVAIVRKIRWRYIRLENYNLDKINKLCVRLHDLNSRDYGVTIAFALGYELH